LWENAEAICEQSGAHLASIHSSTEKDFISSISIVDIWIGASDTHAEVKVKQTIWLIKSCNKKVQNLSNESLLHFVLFFCFPLIFSYTNPM
jgi:hypothetical protein